MLSDEEKREYEELKSLLYTGTISQYGKRKLIDIIEKQQKEIEELKNGQIDFWISDKEIEERIRNKFVNKDKIKAKIEELEIEQESNREDLKIAIDNLLFQNIDKIGNKISINMSVREILQSLLEKE